MRSRPHRWLVGAGLVWLLSGLAISAQTTRIFYRAEGWLTTSPETQTHLIYGTLQAWEEMADTIEARGPRESRLSVRGSETLRLLECVRVAPGLTPEQMRQAIQAYAAQHREAIFSTFAVLVGRALDRRCPAPPAG